MGQGGIEAAKAMPKVRADVTDADWDAFPEGYAGAGI